MGEVSIHQKISWEILEDIGYLSFVDPPENRMDTLFFKELHYLTSRTIPKSDITALIISGSGRHFSSGANLDDLFVEMRKDKNNTGILLSHFHSIRFFDELNIPVIAAIRGVCLGSALELALQCHFRLCASDAILGLPESGFGLIPGLGGIPKLTELSGKAKAMELVLRGNTFNASDAMDWHIVDALYPKKLLMTKAAQLAKLAALNYRKYNKMNYLSTLDLSPA